MLKRSFMSHTHWPPLSLSPTTHKMKLPGREGKLAVAAGMVTRDVCVKEVPGLEVCAVCGSRHQSRLLVATAQVALGSLKGCGTVLL